MFGTMKTYNGQSLSAVASRLHRLQEQSSEACVEIAAYHAPSECYDDVARGRRKSVAAILAEAGLDADTFEAEIYARLGQSFKAYVLTGLAAS